MTRAGFVVEQAENLRNFYFRTKIISSPEVLSLL
jgi:hypothetical protein